MKDQYTQAVLEVLHSGGEPKKVLQGLKETLAKRGHGKLEGAVLRSVYRKLQSQKSSKEAVVIVAKDEHLQKQKQAIQNALKSLSSSADYDVDIDESIIGGVIVRTKNQIVDASYKTKLVNLYRSITK